LVKREALAIPTSERGPVPEKAKARAERY